MVSKLILVFGDDLEQMKSKAEELRSKGHRANLRSLTYWQGDVESQASGIVILPGEASPGRAEAVASAYGDRVLKDDSKAEAAAKAKAEAEAKAEAKAEAGAKAKAGDK